MKNKQIIIFAGLLIFWVTFCLKTEAQQTNKTNRVVPCFHFSAQAPFAFGFRFFQKKIGVFSALPDKGVDEMFVWVSTDKDLSPSSLAGNYSPRSGLFFLLNILVDEKLKPHSSIAIEHSFDLTYSKNNRYYKAQDKYGSSLNRNFDVKMNKISFMYRFAASARIHKLFSPTFFVSGGVSLVDFHMIYDSTYPSSYNKDEILLKPRIDIGLTLPICIEW